MTLRQMWFDTTPNSKFFAFVAQLDRASVYETGGYRLESCRGHQHKENIMELKTQFHTSDFLSDEDNGPGKSSLDANIYVDVQGVMPNEKEKIRMVLNTFYQDLRVALKNISVH